KVRLESVRRKSGGRIHLTPRVPRSGTVTTLCGQTLAEGSFAASDAGADCSNCIRRSQDQGRISGAFFAQEEGSELLRLSLEQARARKPQPATSPAPTAGGAGAGRASSEPAVVWPAAKPPPEQTPDQLGELVTRGFKAAADGVWRSPAGVIVRMRKHGKEWRFAELVFEGSLVATRVDGGMRLQAGDVEVRPTGTGFEVQLKKR
ncbi:MAG TPA: hypothetical protein VET26_02345, partial [Candidatus Sulfotelmatobacter sp.]|nr:hypothetical protein [Candidatus Sulfotelmatobacter sp.]